MDNRIRQIVYGTLLGDGYISRHYDKRQGTYNYEFRVEHSTKQESYALWKYRSLESLGVLDPIYRHREASIKGRPIVSDTVTIISCGNGAWMPFRKKFYTEEGIKVVTPEVLNELTPEAVAVWYMDDGFYHIFRNVACIATYSFTLGEHHLMVDALKRITGARASIVTKKPKNYYYLYFPRDETRKFLHSIERYIPEETGMRYKCPLGWEKAVKLPPNFRQCMPMRIPEEDARMLIVDSLKWFAGNNDVSKGFPVVLYQYTPEAYSFKAVHRIFGSFAAALDAAELPTNFI